MHSWKGDEWIVHINKDNPIIDINIIDEFEITLRDHFDEYEIEIYGSMQHYMFELCGVYWRMRFESNGTHHEFEIQGPSTDKNYILSFMP